MSTQTQTTLRERAVKAAVARQEAVAESEARAQAEREARLRGTLQQVAAAVLQIDVADEAIKVDVTGFFFFEDDGFRFYVHRSEYVRELDVEYECSCCHFIDAQVISSLEELGDLIRNGLRCLKCQTKKAANA